VQGSRALREQPLVAAMLSDRLTELRATALLCLQAARLRDRRDDAALVETCMAKLAASRLGSRAADDAVQIHGASGCAAGHLAERFYRDARIMEIIEGSTQVQQTLIASLAYETGLAR
jgi:alkylation response protein AidB-like acyl-CoA dehydrogenase